MGAIKGQSMGTPFGIWNWQRPTALRTHYRHQHYHFHQKSKCTTRSPRLLCKLHLQYSPSKNGNSPRPHDRCGGDQLDYPGDASSPAAAMLDAKVHINSTISDAHKGARYLGIDIKNYYLGTPMKYYQYIRVLAKMIPQEV
jgi:hypothetical protein